jgi:hypothetical protein
MNRYICTLCAMYLVTTTGCGQSRKVCTCDVDCLDTVVDITVDLPSDPIADPDVDPDPIEDPTTPTPRYRCPCQDMRFYEVCAPDDDAARLIAQALCREVDPTCDCWDGCELIGWCDG